jgi:hypothetical protein
VLTGLTVAGGCRRGRGNLVLAHDRTRRRAARRVGVPCLSVQRGELGDRSEPVPGHPTPRRAAGRGVAVGGPGRGAGRRALGVGTAASIAANVAVGGHDVIGRALAGWPAVALLVSIKLLFPCSIMPMMIGRLSGTISGRPSPVRPSPGRSPGLARTTSAGTVPAERTDGTGRSPTVADGGDCRPERLPRPDLGVPAALVDVRAVSDLTPAARAARAALAKDGRPLSRDAQAERMRDDGYGCPTPAHRCY